MLKSSNSNGNRNRDSSNSSSSSHSMSFLVKLCRLASDLSLDPSTGTTDSNSNKNNTLLLEITSSVMQELLLNHSHGNIPTATATATYLPVSPTPSPLPQLDFLLQDCELSSSSSSPSTVITGDIRSSDSSSDVAYVRIHRSEDNRIDIYSCRKCTLLSVERENASLGQRFVISIDNDNDNDNGCVDNNSRKSNNNGVVDGSNGIIVEGNRLLNCSSSSSYLVSSLAWLSSEGTMDCVEHIETSAATTTVHSPIICDGGNNLDVERIAATTGVRGDGGGEGEGEGLSLSQSLLSHPHQLFLEWQWNVWGSIITNMTMTRTTTSQENIQSSPSSSSMSTSSSSSSSSSSLSLRRDLIELMCTSLQYVCTSSLITTTTNDSRLEGEREGETGKVAVAVRNLIHRCRGVCLTLLRYDPVSHPYHTRAGCRLLRALLSSKAGFGHGLWLGEPLSRLRSGIDVIRSKAKLVLGPMDRSVLVGDWCETYVSVLTAMDSAVVRQHHVTALLTLAMGLFENWDFGSYHKDAGESVMEIAIIKLLRIMWQRQQSVCTNTNGGGGSTKSSSSSKSSKSAGAAAVQRAAMAGWEVMGLNFCVLSLVQHYNQSQRQNVISEQSASPSSSPSSVIITTEALHFCLLNRSRISGGALLSSSCVCEVEQELLDIVIRDDAVCTPSSISTKLVCTKLLDVLYTVPKASSQQQQEQDADDADAVDVDIQEALMSSLGSDLGRWLYQTTITTPREDEDEDENDVGEEKKVNDDDKEDNDEEYEGAVASSPNDPDSPVKQQQQSSSITRELQQYNKLTMEQIEDFHDTEEDHTLIIMMKMNTDTTMVLMWLLCLQRCCSLRTSPPLIRSRCMDALKQGDIVGKMLVRLLHLCPNLMRHKGSLEGTLQQLHPRDIDIDSDTYSDSDHVMRASSSSSLRCLAAYAIFRSVCELPSLVRQWWVVQRSRVTGNLMRDFVTNRVGTALVGREVAAALEASRTGLFGGNGNGDSGEMSVRASVVSREVVAVYTHEDAKLEMKVKMPPSYPLMNAEVECSSRLGFTEGRGDRWKLQIVQQLSLENGSVVDAVLLWKHNVDQELRGVEPCPICYSTLHPRLLSLPTLSCRTCNNKFHSSCLYKWFQTAGKSKCVICQEPFFQ
eukprot:gene3532-7026_t